MLPTVKYTKLLSSTSMVLVNKETNYSLGSKVPIQFIDNCLLRTCYVPDIPLDNEDASTNKNKKQTTNTKNLIVPTFYLVLWDGRER